MARLFSSGFELNSLTAGVEITSSTGTVSIVTSPVRSGTYTLRSNPLSSNGSIQYTFATSAGKTRVYFRFYLRIATAINTAGAILQVNSYIGDPLLEIRLNTDNSLSLLDDYNEVQIGSNSSALNTNTWYRIEVFINTTTLSSSTLTARIEETQF